MPDRAEHDVLFIQHRGDPGLHRIVRDDQAADIVGPLWFKRASGIASRGEVLQPPGQGFERPGNPPQHQCNRPEQQRIKQQRLGQQSHQQGPLGPGDRHPHHHPAVPGGQLNRGDHHFERRRRSVRPQGSGAARGAFGHARILGGWAVEHHDIGGRQPLSGQNLLKLILGWSQPLIAGQQRRLPGLFDPQFARGFDRAGRVPAAQPAFVIGCKQPDRGGVNQRGLAPIPLRAIEQRGADPLRQQQGQPDRQQQLAAQTLWPEVRQRRAHQADPAGTRRTSAASR